MYRFGGKEAVLLKKTDLLLYSIFAIFYIWLAAQIPYTWDDWDWGLDIGMYQFVHATINSRYIGNFFEIIMTRSELLKVVIMGSSYFLIPLMLTQLSAKHIRTKKPALQRILFLWSNCLLLTINRIMWKQTYGWVAGFANFSISAIFLMFWIKELLCAFDETIILKTEPLIKLIFSFVLSICGQLFIENLAMYCTLLSFVLCVIYYIRFRKIPIKNLLMVVGSIIGLIIMFTSSLYDTLFSTGMVIGDYRHIPFLDNHSIQDTIIELVRQCAALVIRLYSINFTVSVAVLVLLSCIIADKRNLTTIKHQKIYVILNFSLIVGFAICNIYDNTCDSHLFLMYIFDFIVSGLYFLIVTCQLLLFVKKELQFKLFALWLSAPAVIAPLLVTTERGHRLFFTSNIFIILFALLLLGHLINSTPFILTKYFSRFSVVVTAVLLCFHSFIYAQIGECKQTRDDIINSIIPSETDEILLPRFPFESYLHYPDPISDQRMEFFKEFYGIPEQVEVNFE